MKKLIFLVCLLVGVGISANLYAQGTGVAPQIGTTHTYSVTAHGDNTFLWDVTSDVAGSTSVAGSVATLSATSGTSIDITWVNPSIGTTYYVHVIETADGTSCKNRKALAVKPVNAFALQIVNVNSSDAEQVDSWATCPPDVTVTAYTGTHDGTLAESQEFTYDFSENVKYYKITASGINTTNTGWSPIVTIAHTNTTNATVTAGWATSIGGTYTSLSNVSGGENDITVAANNASIWIKVTIDNKDSATPGLEGTTAQNFTVTLVSGANKCEDANGNDATSLGNGNRIQIVSARPATTSISTTPAP